jgi:lipopolysaccharide/colanic/teichoic acid biosynthesis glycosyltransferase
LWQVSGRSDLVHFDQLAELDLVYIDNWSLWLDVKILLRTILVVLSTKGAK